MIRPYLRPVLPALVCCSKRFEGHVTGSRTSLTVENIAFVTCELATEANFLPLAYSIGILGSSVEGVPVKAGSVFSDLSAVARQHDNVKAFCLLDLANDCLELAGSHATSSHLG